MEYSPITTSIAAMSECIGDSQRRALYMVAKELYLMYTNTANNTTNLPLHQGNIDFFGKTGKK